MKTLTVFLAAIALSFVVSVNSYAKAHVFKDHFHGVLRACDGDLWVELDGEETIVIKVQENKNSFHGSFKIQGNYIGYDEQDNEYILNYHASDTFHVNKNNDHLIWKETEFEKLVSKGSGENYNLRIEMKIVLNANGEPTVEIFLYEDYCEED